MTASHDALAATRTLPATPVTVALLALLLAVVYWPGLRGPFVADDRPNIVANAQVRVEALSIDELAGAAASNDSGALGRMIPALSFGLSYWFAGQRFNHFSFSFTNLCIHLINALLALALARRLLGAGGMPAGRAREWTAGTAALIWALHPIQLTNVLYAVQRINALAALFTLAGLLVFMVGRQRLREGRGGAFALMLGGSCGGTALGLLCKENAALLPALTLVLEVTLFRGAAAPGKRRRLLAFYAGTAVLPYLAGVLLAVFWVDLWADGYRIRDFDATERLLSEPRVLWWYLQQLLVPDLAQLTFFHDDFAPSRGLLEPPATLAALLGWLVLGALALWSLRRGPWLALAVGWFLVGHALEASMVPLELVYEHRNYVPSLGLFVALCALAGAALRRLDTRPAVAAVAAGLTVLVLGASTFARAQVWGDAGAFAGVGVARKPDSARAHSVQATYLSARGAPIDLVYPHFARVAELEPRAVGERISMLKLVAELEHTDLQLQAYPDAMIRDTRGRPLLRLDPASLAAEHARLNAQVGRLLAGNPLHIGWFQGLRDMVERTEAAVPRCVALETELRGWLEAAAGNARFDLKARQGVRWLIARLQLRDGQRDAAIDTIDSAVALDPGHVTLQHQRVLLLLRAGRVEQAEARLAELRTLDGGPGHRKALRVLEERVSDARRR